MNQSIFPRMKYAEYEDDKFQFSEFFHLSLKNTTHNTHGNMNYAKSGATAESCRPVLTVLLPAWI